MPLETPSKTLCFDLSIPERECVRNISSTKPYMIIYAE
jgi:hypothetical protein